MASTEHVETSYEANQTLSAATKGIYYQLKLLMLLMIRGVRKECDFRLGAEVKLADKFDDVTFEFKDPTDKEYRSVLIQLKHRLNEDKSITAEELLSTDDKSDYSIIKYFKSWRRIHEEAHFSNIHNVVIYTNIDLDPIVQTVINLHKLSPSERLDLLDIKCSAKHPTQYKLLSENNELFQKFKIATHSYGLADKLCHHLVLGKLERLQGNELMKSYHLALCAHVLSVEDAKKKKQARIKADLFESTSEDVIHFRKQMELCFKARGKTVDEAMKLTMAVPDNFGEDKSGTALALLPPKDKSLDYEMKIFADQLLLCVDQPSEDELELCIIEEMKVMYDPNNAEILYNDFLRQIKDWFIKCSKDNKKEYYTHSSVKKLLSGWHDRENLRKFAGLTAEFPARLSRYGLQFQRGNDELAGFLQGDQRVFHLHTQNTLLGAAMALQTWRETPEKTVRDCLFVELSLLLQPGMRDAVKSALRASCKPLLVLEWNGPYTDEGMEFVLSTLSLARVVSISEFEHDFIKLPHVVSRLEQSSLQDLTPECIKRIFDIHVSFQGCDVRLGDVLSDDACHLIDNNLLENLVKKHEKIVIGRELRKSRNYNAMYYIPRRFIKKKVVISQRILTDKECPDLIAVTGVSEEKLRKMIVPGAGISTDLSNVDNYEVARFYIFAFGNAEEEFETLCKNHAGKHVHWLNIDYQRITLIKSNGFGSILKYRQTSEDNGVEDSEYDRAVTWSETELAEEQEHVVISDGAGMGKSTVLEALVEAVVRVSPASWVMRIDLNHNTKILNKLTKSLLPSEDILINELLGLERYSLSDKLLRHCLTSKNQHKVVVMLDAVDEISPDYTQVVTELMQRLKKSNARLIVTTRPHMCEAVEHCLAVPAHSLQPLSAIDQSTFLVKFWCQRLGVTAQKVDIYAKALVRKIREALYKENDAPYNVFLTFCGVPLQLKMLAEVYADVSSEDFQGCRQFCASQTDAPLLPPRIEINDLYQQFIEKKSDVVLEKRGVDFSKVCAKKIKQHERQNFIIRHKRLAITALLSEHVQDLMDKKEQQAVFKDMLIIQKGELNDGLVTGLDSRVPVFIHQTFAEYLVAEFFYDSINKLQKKDRPRHEVLLRNILVNIEFQIIRQFINSRLSLTKKKMILFIRTVNVADTIYEMIMKVAILESLDDILECVFVAKKYTLPVEKLICLAVSMKRATSLRLLLGCCGDTAGYQDCLDTQLRRCARGGWAVGVRCLHAHGASLRSQNACGETALHCHVNSYVVKQELVEYLVLQGAPLDVKDNKGRTPLALAVRKNQADVVQLLVEFGSDLNAEENCRVTVLQTAIQNCANCIVQYLLTKGAIILQADHWHFIKKAVLVKDVELLTILLDHGANINILDNIRDSLVHMCARKGWYDGVVCLAEHGVKLDSRNMYGQTPLHVGSSGGSARVVQYLVSRGAQLDPRDNRGRTPLLVAAKNGRADIIKVLVQAKSDINAVDNTGTSVLQYAVDHCESTALEYLLTQGARVDSVDHWDLMMKALRDQDSELLRGAVLHGVDVNMSDSFGNTLLHIYSRRGWREGVHSLCEQGVLLDTQNHCGETALINIVNNTYSFNVDIAEYLLALGARADIRDNTGWTALLYAVRRDGIDYKVFILQDGDVNTKDNQGFSLLQTAIQNKNIGLIQFLLEKQAVIEATDHWPLMMRAVHFEDVHLLSTVLLRGVDANMVDNNGNSMLHVCAEEGWYEGVRCLCEHGAAPNQQNVYGDTALSVHMNSPSIKHDVIEYLISRGARPDVRDNNGRTPLHLAVRKIEPTIVKLLLDCGCDVNCRDNDGDSVLDYALKHRHTSLICQLIKAGATFDPTTYWDYMRKAVLLKDIQQLTTLLIYAEDVEMCDSNGDTLLHVCARIGWYEGMRCLREHGAELNVQNKFGVTALHCINFQPNSISTPLCD